MSSRARVIRGRTAHERILILSSIALLRAIADKLVPGIPHATRIAILQQTDDGSDEEAQEDRSDKRQRLPVVEYVLAGDEYKNEIMKKMNSESRESSHFVSAPQCS